MRRVLNSLHSSPYRSSLFQSPNVRFPLSFFSPLFFSYSFSLRYSFPRSHHLSPRVYLKEDGVAEATPLHHRIFPPRPFYSVTGAASRAALRHSQLTFLFPISPLLSGTLPLLIRFFNNFCKSFLLLILFFDYIYFLKKTLRFLQPPKPSDRAQVQSKEVRLPDSRPLSLDDQDVQIVS